MFFTSCKIKIISFAFSFSSLFRLGQIDAFKILCFYTKKTKQKSDTKITPPNYCTQACTQGDINTGAFSTTQETTTDYN